jgi:hypothetical protein
MAMTFTRDQLEQAELLVVVDPLGNYRWSSERSADEVADYLERLAEDLRTHTQES